MLSSGMQLGRYRLLNLLGSGSLSDVYLAEDDQSKRQIVLKVLHIKLQPEISQESIHLFQDEAKNIAELNHPYILPLLDFGHTMVDENVVFYSVMPLCKEGSFDTWLRERGTASFLSPSDIVAFLNPFAEALQYAHEQQVVHQGIRPTNFLLRRRRQTSFPDLLLTDFSLTSLLLPIPNSPTYVAPEQWKGQPVPATDQYALATITFQLLTGSPPFKGTPEQVKQQHLTSQPSRIHNADINRDIDNVVLMGLAKKPEGRFASITAFAHAFKQAANLQNAAPIIARTPTSPLIQATNTGNSPIANDPISFDREGVKSTPLPLPSPQQISTITTPITPSVSLDIAVRQPESVYFPSMKYNTSFSGILSLFFITLVVVMGSLGIYLKYQVDKPLADETATATVIDSNYDISAYTNRNGVLLYYNPMNSARRGYWFSDAGDTSRTCAYQVLGNGLSVTSQPNAPSPTPTSSQQAYHICFNSLPSSDNSLVNMIFEVQIKFMSDTAIGGIVFQQESTAPSEPTERFIFSIWQNGKYELCYIKNGGPCTPLMGPMDSGLKVESDFNRIAVVLQNQSIKLYLNDQPLNASNISLGNDSHINHIDTIGVIAKSSDSKREAYLFYREAKVWLL